MQDEIQRLKQKALQNNELISRLEEQHQLIREEQEARLREYEQKRTQLSKKNIEDRITSNERIKIMEEKSSKLRAMIQESDGELKN